MVEVKLRYVTSRPKKNGRLLWYWQRKGFPLVRLPDNERARVAKALRLNEQADSRHDAGKTVDHGTFGWIIPRYRASDSFKEKAQNTKDAYESWLKRYEVDLKDNHVSEFDFTMVSDFLQGLAAKGLTTQLPHAVLKNLFEQARYDRLITENPAQGVRIKRPQKRQQVWSKQMIDALLAACMETPGGAKMVLAVKLLLYTAQRPCDIRAMTWARWKDGAIMVRQQKTGTLLQVWCHSELRDALTVAKETASGLTIVTDEIGRPLSESKFRRWFDAACEKAEIGGMQARDFRRTAILKLAEAKCTALMIASVSGHSYSSVDKILETYLPRTPEMTRMAIEQMEQSENEKSKRLDSIGK